MVNAATSDQQSSWVWSARFGGVLGFYTFRWLLGQGFYGLMIPGAFLGLGCSLLAQHPSVVRGVFCGIAAFALSQFTEWYFPLDRR